MKTIKYCACVVLLSLVVIVAGCKKLIDINLPTNELVKDKILLDSATANAAMLNPYALLEERIGPDLGKFLSVYTDEMSTVNSQEYSESRLTASNPINYNMWGFLYQVIYQCNDLLEQLSKPSLITPSQVKSMTGEASFLRAFCYFYLVNLYDRVPLLLVTDVNQTRRALQSGQGSIYQIMITDLKLAKESLSATYIGTGKVRANKWAAAALLARVYLYRKEFALAEKEASEVIDCGLYALINPIANTNQAGSKEQILQLWNSRGYVINGTDFLPPAPNQAPNFLITPNLYNSFEPNDLRRSFWIGNIASGASIYHYLNKYKNSPTQSGTPEQFTVLRLAEQYLIRAEARVWQNKITGTDGALADINTIRNRAGLPNIEGGDQNSTLLAIENERRHELTADWGDRFINLKRTARLNEVMFPFKASWQANASALPIPQLEIVYNPNLIQNPGY
jgi:hypothetical protein